jgi:hypothetical protein
MKLHLFGFTLLSITVMAAVTLTAVSAQAQSAIRTFVSTTGSDTNPCSITSPCRHFSAAVAATAVDGEVDALEPGAYGSFSISQGITIEGQGWSYVAPPSGAAAITINAVSGTVNIRGISLNGVGVSNAFGIQFNSGGSLNVRDCVIRNFTHYGIFLNSSTVSSQFSVSNALVTDNSYGIVIAPFTGSTTTAAAFEHVELVNNQHDALIVQPQELGETIKVTVSDSLIANNNNGIVSDSSFGGVGIITVRNSAIANNTGDGLSAMAAGATIRVTRSTITGNATGWSAASSGVVTSYNDNDIDDNTAGDTAPPCVNGTSPCSAYK